MTLVHDEALQVLQGVCPLQHLEQVGVVYVVLALEQQVRQAAGRCQHLEKESCRETKYHFSGGSLQ